MHAQSQLFKQPILNKYLLKTVLLVSRALKSIGAYGVMLEQELMLGTRFYHLLLLRTKTLNREKTYL